MAISNNRKDLDKNSFVEDSNGIPARNITGSVGAFNVNYLLAKGAVEGFELINIFGRNGNVDLAAIFEAVWDFGGDYVFPSSAAQLDVVSDNINDDILGTGARKVTIVGLDSNYDEITETIDLDGTTTVQTTQSFFRVNGAFVLESGANGGATGNITIKNGSLVVAYIQPIFNTTLMAVYTIPNNKNGYLYFTSARAIPRNSASGTKTGELFVIAKEENKTAAARSLAGLSSNGTSDVAVTLDFPIFFPPKTDVRAVFLPGSPNTVVSVTAQLLLEDIDGN